MTEKKEVDNVLAKAMKEFHREQDIKGSLPVPDLSSSLLYEPIVKKPGTGMEDFRELLPEPNVYQELRSKIFFLGQNSLQAKTGVADALMGGDSHAIVLNKVEKKSAKVKPLPRGVYARLDKLTRGQVDLNP